MTFPPVAVLYCTLDNAHAAQIEKRWIGELAPSVVQWISTKRRSRDRVASILGRLLLSEALQHLGARGIQAKILGRTSTGEPVVPHPYCGSIAHGGDIVIAVASVSVPVGVDVERHDAIQGDTETLIRRFERGERAFLTSASAHDHRFLTDIWVRKEAIAKASGSKLDLVLNMSVMNDTVQINDRAWFFQRLDIHSDHSCAIASSTRLRPLVAIELLPSRFE